MAKKQRSCHHFWRLGEMRTGGWVRQKCEICTEERDINSDTKQERTMRRGKRISNNDMNAFYERHKMDILRTLETMGPREGRKRWPQMALSTLYSLLSKERWNRPDLLALLASPPDESAAPAPQPGEKFKQVVGVAPAPAAMKEVRPVELPPSGDVIPQRADALDMMMRLAHTRETELQNQLGVWQIVQVLGQEVKVLRAQQERLLSALDAAGIKVTQ